MAQHGFSPEGRERTMAGGTEDGGIEAGQTAPELDTTSVSPADLAQSTPEAGDTTAQSPSADKGETKESLLDSVLKAVAPDKPDANKQADQGGAAPGSETPNTGAEGTGQAKPLSEDPTAEELSRYSSHTRERIKLLLSQRNDARRERDTLRHGADASTGLRTFLEQNDIGKEDFAVLVDLGVALKKGDFRTFYQGVLPYVQLAEEALGFAVAPDVRAQVEQGQMTVEAARRFTQERVARQMSENQAYLAQERANSQQQAHAVTQLQNSVSAAVTQWEAGIRQTDPDYGAKQELVRNMLWSVVQEVGAPQNPQQAVLIAQEAYRRANETAARFRPAPRATQAVPSSTARATGARPEPKNLMEAAMLGLERARHSA